MSTKVRFSKGTERLFHNHL